MSDLAERLARLGLSQYLEALVSEGFDTWETVLDITESDLGSLSVKLGHRRKLQRAIAETRRQSSNRPLPIALENAGSVDGSYRSDDSATETKVRQGEASTTGVTPGAKRKYRRHPKPDEHAPERPPSAYVIFSNQVRETLKGQDLSFTEIAKIVGERWQVLPADSREACERQANSAKEKYYAELAEYKKTSEYELYQKYLEEFKAKHAAPPKEAEGKRSKIEADTVASTRSSSHDQTERTMGRRISSAQSDLYAGQILTESSPPIGPSRLPSGPSHPSKSTSPAILNRSGFNSPRMPEHYSPLSASPRSATLNKENSFETTSSVMARDARSQFDAGLPYSSSYGHGSSYPPSTTPPSYNAHYQAPIDLPSRRSNREMHRLPPLTHEDTTLSSDSGQGGYTASYTGQTLPAIDVSKSMRVLPAPVLSGMGSAPSHLDRPSVPLPSKHTQQHTDYRTNSSLAALLRAGELARVADADADDEDMDTPGYS
ncbi:uncharacterized protein N0V89_012521 [Didymosphaeria variabile]|uniref:HMG box domain-containing protein n=1 Tax=Didymosphaeria variabile TaxID=1932322 RepID=A0A9W8X9B9_9PLEO|nr:uncharacterized protein N0V89_012521 [Didymosphaeria variabile]KAJ4344777.1 hypothetical protein N0V89_012521 [Didymosphaeria variabile]